MRYHFKAPDAEWAIEGSNDTSWVLNKLTQGDWHRIGCYRSPNEAAVTVGAQVAGRLAHGQRHLSRLKFVLSSWKQS
jgi:hypothetical protein